MMTEIQTIEGGQKDVSSLDETTQKNIPLPELPMDLLIPFMNYYNGRLKNPFVKQKLKLLIGKLNLKPSKR